MQRTVLIVGLGAGGGVGRYELLVDAALRSRPGVDVAALWRRRHPDYLWSGRPAPADLAERSRSIPRFVRDYLSASRDRPDVVLFTHVNAARLGLARRVPYVVVAHGEEVWTRLPAPQRLALRRAAAVISVSAHTKERLCEAQGVAPEKVAVVPLALEPSSMPAAAPLPDGPLRLLSVARLEQGFEDKGVDDVIRAMPAVLRELPEVMYSVVGAGSDVPRLRELARSSGVEAAVDFAGALDHQALLDAYRACTAFVLPSRREGFGLVFLEAMAVGRPVIAANAGGAREVVIDGETGVLVDDTALLADAIVSLLRDPARCHSFGQAGRARVERELSFERFAEETERVLRGV